MAESLITGALVDLARAKQYLQQPPVGADPDTSPDEMITQMINYATGQIRAHCGRQLLSGTLTAQLHNGTGCNELRTREYPIVSVSAIVERLKDPAGTTRTLTITGLLIEGERTIRLPADTFTKGDQNIAITYVAGYASPARDHEIKAIQGAALRWIQVMWQDQSHGVGRGVTFGVGGESANLIDTPMPKDVALALAPFRRLY